MDATEPRNALIRIEEFLVGVLHKRTVLGKNNHAARQIFARLLSSRTAATARRIVGVWPLHKRQVQHEFQISPCEILSTDIIEAFL